MQEITKEELLKAIKTVMIFMDQNQTNNSLFNVTNGTQYVDVAVQLVNFRDEENPDTKKQEV